MAMDPQFHISFQLYHGVMVEAFGRSDVATCPTPGCYSSISIHPFSGSKDGDLRENDSLEEAIEAMLPFFWSSHVDQCEKPVEMGLSRDVIPHPALRQCVSPRNFLSSYPNETMYLNHCQRSDHTQAAITGALDRVIYLLVDEPHGLQFVI